jgi:hypothetical protein
VVATAPVRLSDAYERMFAAQLDAIASTPAIPSELNMFWPKIGSRYDGDLLVIGRATNGWIDRWEPGSHPDMRALARIARGTGEDGVNGDQLGWVLDRWGRSDGYNTSKSQFWSTIRRVAIHLRPDAADAWTSVIAWTNFAKVGPWNKGNPPSRLLAPQLRLGPQLFAQEIQDLRPRHVVAFTGRWWFATFTAELRLDIRWQTGLVEGVADSPGTRWVVAVHPQTRSPAGVAGAVIGSLSAKTGVSP